MKLSEYFTDCSLVRDNEFMRLGYVDSKITQVLAYADNLKHLQKAITNSNVTCLIVTPELSNENASPLLPLIKLYCISWIVLE